MSNQQDLEQQAPELFAFARELREQYPQPGAVRLRNIRINVDDDGEGGELIAGAWPDETLRPGEVVVDYKLRHRKPDDEPDQPYRGRAR